jgi:hypothetical protein
MNLFRNHRRNRDRPISRCLSVNKPKTIGTTITTTITITMNSIVAVLAQLTTEGGKDEESLDQDLDEGRPVSALLLMIGSGPDQPVARPKRQHQCRFAFKRGRGACEVCNKEMTP